MKCAITVRLTMWHHLFLEFWLVDTWFLAYWRNQRAVIRLENVRQLNIRRGKKLDFKLSHRHPHNEVRTILNFIMSAFITLKWNHLPYFKKGGKIRNLLKLHYLLKYAIISVNSENIKQWRKCALWFFLFVFKHDFS